MVKKSAVTEKQFLNFKSKEITYYPDTENGYFKQNKIREFYNKVKSTLPEGSKVIVRGMNIVRGTTLKGYNDDFMTDEQFEEYARGKVKDVEKFNVFKNFTVTVLEPSTEPSLFPQHKSKRGKK
jgi:hypothetical protein